MILGVLVLRLVVLSVLLSLLAVVAAAEPDLRVDMLEAYLEQLQVNNKSSGAVAVSIDGTELVNKQIGIAFPSDTQTTPNSETQYRIGSITKTFTAVMMLQLVEEGKVTLDTPLSQFFPNIPKANNITVEHMLRHQSGLDNLTDDPIYLTYYTAPQTRSEMLARMEVAPPDFEPGTRTEYSNTNFVLLGYMIEDLTGESYADALKSRISNKLDLNRTSYMTPSSVEQNVALSFSCENNEWIPIEPETDPTIPHGAGAIMSTPSNLNVFIEGLFTGKLINETSLAKMTLLDQVGLGMGIFMIPFNKRRGFGHNGGIDGFQSVLAYFPEEQVAVALISNGGCEGSPSLNDVLIELLRIAFLPRDTGSTPLPGESSPPTQTPEESTTTSGAAEAVKTSVTYGSAMLEKFLLSVWTIFLLF